MSKSALRFSALKLLPLSFLLFGCGTQRNGSLLTIRPGMRGLVHGGQQPIIGATIQLYSVGTTADGAASTPLLSPAPVTDANGNFNISGTYSCPSSSSLVYVVASGGNPGLASGTNNAAISLMAALGPCGNLTASTYIFINELTTLAAVYSLAPYMASASAIGSSSTDTAALVNAFTLASEFVNTANGTAPGTGVPTGTVVPVAQINTIGDIFAPCIDSAGGTAGDSTACGNLFALTTLTGSTAPTNTVAALLNLANNPAWNTASLYSLIPADAPFQPAQPQTPPDLSVRLIVPSGFTASPSALNFPATRIGVESTLTVTFTNNTATPVGIDIANILNSSPTASGADPYDFRPAFSTSSLEDCPTPVLPGATCSVQLTFSPLATGARSAYLVVNNTSANPVIWILLTGEGLEAGAGPAALTPGGLGFTAPGSPMSTTLSNIGTLALTIDSISISNDPTSGQPGFTQTNNCGSSLAPQATCTIAVSALSTTQQYSTGVLTVGDDAAAGPQTASLYYSNGFSGEVLVNFGSRSVGTQGAGVFSFEPSGYPSGLNTLSLTGSDATDFSFQASSSSQSSSCTTSRQGPICGGAIYFTPSAQGMRSATLNINGSPAGGVIGVGLSAGLHFSMSPASIDFGSVFIGQTSTGSGVSIVNTGTAALTFNAPVLSGPNPPDFTLVSTCSSLPPNGTCGVGITASPTQPTNRFATLTLSDSTGTAQQTASLRVLGVNPAPVANPNTLAFAYTPSGSVSAPQSFTVTSYNNDPVTLTLGDAQFVPFFFTQGSSCTRTPCQISVAFAPTAATIALADGNNSYDQIFVTDLFSGQAAVVNVSGINQPPPVLSLSLSPGSLTFPLQSVGTTSTAQSITLTNTGNQALVGVQPSLSGTDAGDYLMTNNCQSTVAVGANCNMVVTFFPTASGTREASVYIVSNAASSPDSVPLTGTAQ
jgi:trimeric autotransporter adhesin